MPGPCDHAGSRLGGDWQSAEVSRSTSPSRLTPALPGAGCSQYHWQGLVPAPRGKYVGNFEPTSVQGSAPSASHLQLLPLRAHHRSSGGTAAPSRTWSSTDRGPPSSGRGVITSRGVCGPVGLSRRRRSGAPPSRPIPRCCSPAGTCRPGRRWFTAQPRRCTAARWRGAARWRPFLPTGRRLRTCARRGSPCSHSVGATSLPDHRLPRSSTQLLARMPWRLVPCRLAGSKQLQHVLTHGSIQGAR